jgi:signal transduction histidine kinase
MHDGSVNARPTALGAMLTVGGAALVLWGMLARPGLHPVWATALGLVSVAAWVLRTGAAMMGWRRVAVALTLIGAVTGAAAAAGTEGTSVVPAAVCVSLLVADDELPVAVGAVTALVSLGLVAGGAIAQPVPLLSLAALLGAIVLGFLGGYSRRQIRRAQQREAMLAECDIAAREEASRVAIARDLHDVLAHTLGGLVIQLDAADALLEAGDAAAARARVASARDLAGAGLGEARRAVAALRDPGGADAEEDVEPAEFGRALEDLVAAHRSLGGDVGMTASGAPRALSAAQAGALQRALQEALSNARRHAPGAPVAVRLEWRPDRVRLAVTNPVASTARTADQGGYGLVGMGERFAALPLGGSVATAEQDGAFTVTAEAMLGPSTAEGRSRG